MNSKDEGDTPIHNTYSGWKNQRNIRPKRLREDLPFGASHAHYDDLYEFDADQFFNSLWFARPYRPLPAISTLLSSSSANPKKDKDKEEDEIKLRNYDLKQMPPFLQEYFEKMNPSNELLVGSPMSEPCREVGPLMIDSQENQKEEADFAKLDATSTLLTQGHHKRLIHFLRDINKDECADWTRLDPLRLKEFQKLRKLLDQERKLYLEVLKEFREAHKNRFLLGFTVSGPASSLVQAYPLYTRSYWNAYKASDLSNNIYFRSKSIQAIALDSFSSKIEDNEIYIDFNDKIASKSFDVNSLAPVIVHRFSNQALFRLQSGWMDSCLNPGSVLSSSHPKSYSFHKRTQFISQDLEAKRIAYQHGADIIMSSETMQSLLVRPGSYTSQWIIPILYEDCRTTNRDSWSLTARGRDEHRTIIMEDPIPQKMTPRQSLSFGCTEAMYDAVTSSSSPASNNTISEVIKEFSGEALQSYEMVYTLLTIPAMGTTTKSFKVLVRSCNLMVDESERPIRLYNHLEYFSERGREESTSYEQCIWMMEKMLQPNCRVILSRVDVQNMKIIATEDMTAQVTMNQNQMSLDSRIFFPLEKETDPHFQSFIYLLHAIVKNTSRSGSRYLLCMPSKDESVSFPQTTATVHNFAESDLSGDLQSLEKHIEDAVEVTLGRTSLLSCFRHWIWDQSDRNRIPYTFRPGTR